MFARIARYTDSISVARKNGYTWKELVEVLTPATGVKNERRLADAYKRAVKAIDDGRLSPQQLPLPREGESKSNRPKAQALSDNPSVVGQRPLPTVPGRIPDDPDERLAALAKKGIVFK